MASILLTINDDRLLSQIKKACLLLKGVSDVKVVKSVADQKDITKTNGYKEALSDIKAGRIYSAANTEEMFRQILENV